MDSLLSTFKEYVFAYTLYQLILLSVFKLKDSIEIDALTAMKYHTDKFQTYVEFSNKIPKEEIELINIKLAQNQKMTLNTKHREYLRNLIQIAKNYNNDLIEKNELRLRLKQESINLDLILKQYGYHWMNSILLRVIK